MFSLEFERLLAFAFSFSFEPRPEPSVSPPPCSRFSSLAGGLLTPAPGNLFAGWPSPWFILAHHWRLKPVGIFVSLFFSQINKLLLISTLIFFSLPPCQLGPALTWPENGIEHYVMLEDQLGAQTDQQVVQVEANRAADLDEFAPRLPGQTLSLCKGPSGGRVLLLVSKDAATQLQVRVCFAGTELGSAFLFLFLEIAEPAGLWFAVTASELFCNHFCPLFHGYALMSKQNFLFSTNVNTNTANQTQTEPKKRERERETLTKRSKRNLPSVLTSRARCRSLLLATKIIGIGAAN